MSSLALLERCHSVCSTKSLLQRLDLAHEGRGSRGPLPKARGTLVFLLGVERLPRGERRREPRVWWLWWHGEGEPDLDLFWQAYVRRFDLEHTFRFLKQTLGWTTPRLCHSEQADRWTWLVVAAFTQLRLARPCVEDRRLPWERRYDPERLTPVRVRRVVLTLLPELGTPAKPSKPCGRSPGRPKGFRSGQSKRYRPSRRLPEPAKTAHANARWSPNTTRLRSCCRRSRRPRPARACRRPTCRAAGDGGSRADERVRISRGQQGSELLPDRLDDVSWDGGHGLAPSLGSFRHSPDDRASPYLLYMGTLSLLAEALSYI